MDDKNLMENILQLEKGACELFMHGAIESSSGNVHNTFKSAFSDSLDIQNTVYGKMSSRGWYPSEKAEQNKIACAKQKFDPAAQQ